VVESSPRGILYQNYVVGALMTFISQDQAFDRAHRFGQTRDVNIFKLKIDETVEDRILLVSWIQNSGI